MNGEKRVRDLMRPCAEYARVAETSSLREAAEVLRASYCPAGEPCLGRRTVLVTDGRGKVTGLLNFRALLAAVQPDFLREEFYSPQWRFVREWAVPVFWEGLFVRRCREVANRRVGDVMYPAGLIGVEAGDPLVKAAYAMIKHRLETLPVLEGGEVVGLIRSGDLFLEMARVLGVGGGPRSEKKAAPV